ncbi:hypothetical protein QVD17_25197 [Tagetes erecta]|uniref:Cytochrome P450 n=1 Tax=Tagetes erecta TaxID=13708 RepID=A0AAD8KMD4_TARER|nr:hypothetical protein QVD17_25197 [Tagetes erecta]
MNENGLGCINLCLISQICLYTNRVINMEYHLLVSTSIFLVLVVSFLLHIFTKNKQNKLNHNSPPHAKGGWPIIGHLYLLAGSQIPHKVLSQMAETYGQIFTMKLGIHNVLVVSSREVAKECFTTNDKAFASRPKSRAFEIMGYDNAIFAFSPYGDYWRHIRKIVTCEVLSQKRVEMLENVRVSEVRASVKDIYDAWLINKESQGLDMVKVEMKQWFGNVVLNVVTRIISGRRFRLNDEEGVRVENVVKKFMDLLGVFMVSDYVPFLDRFDIGGHQKEMKMTGKEMDNIIEDWLKTRKQGNEKNDGDQYFMDVLVSVIRDASNNNDFHGYDRDTTIKATCLAIISAGSDTTVVTLTWALSLLLNNPSALKAAQAEIDKHVGRDRLVEESDLKNLVYLNAIIKETLRLYPVVPLSLPHESIEDCIVNGYNVPKGTRLMVNLWKIHHDPNIWPNPSEFKPERFLTSQNDIDLKGKHYELLPFGTGRRMCPGVIFALQVLPLVLASVIQQFVLLTPSNEPIDMSEGSGATIHKTTPLEVLIAPRLSVNMYSGGA